MAQQVVMKYEEVYTEKVLERVVLIDPTRKPADIKADCLYLIEAYNATKQFDASPQKYISYRIEDIKATK